MANLPKEFKIYKIICYLRRSRQDIEREKRTGEDTLGEQDNLMTRVLDNYEILYDKKPEIGSGDKISTRPVFQEILKDLEKGLYQAIAVKEISRLGRGSYTDMGKIYDLLVENRLFIITPYKIYDPKNPADLRQIRFELFMSREEYETTKERLMGSRYTYSMLGKWMAGTVPFGFKFNSTTQKLEPKEDEAKLKIMLGELYAYGIDGHPMGFRAISTYLKRLGIKTSKGKDTWQPMVIQKMILDSVNIGQVKFRLTERKNGKQIKRPTEEHIIVDNAHEPIYSDKLYYDILKKYENRNKTPRNKLDFSPCELASLVVCKKCGRKMVRNYSVQNYKKQNGEISKYHKEFLWCTTQGCTFVKYRDVEKLILQYLEKIKELDKDKLIKLVSSSQQNNEVDKNDLLENIKQRKKELKNKLNFIFEKFESGVYTDEIFLERKTAIEKEINDLKNVQLPKQEIKKENIDIDKIKYNIASLLDLYGKTKDKSDRNKLLRQILEKVELEIIKNPEGKKSTKPLITPHLNYTFLV